MASDVMPPTAVAGLSRGRIAAACCTLVAAAGVVGIGLGEAAVTAGAPAWVEVVGVAALAAITAAAWASSDRHVLAAQGLALYAGTLAAAHCATLLELPDRAQLVLSAASPLGVLAAGLVAVGWRASWTESALLLPAMLAGTAAGLMALAFNPLHEPACPFACPDVPALAESWVSSRNALTAAALLAVASVLAVIAAWWRRCGLSAPLVVPVTGLVAAASSAAPLGIRALGWTGSYNASAVFVLPSAGGLALATAVVATAIAHARARSRAARVSELIAGLAEDRVAVDDVHFAVPGEGRWIDASGTPAAPGDGFVVVRDRGFPIARVAADSRLRFAGERLGASSMLALRNAQLTAVARLRVDELQASRRRIVDVSDAESRRIERDLHDGAQQRLVSSMLYLAVARAADPDLVELETAEEALSGALAQLRSLAHGIYPELLRSEGLWTALRDVADGLPVAISVEPLDLPTPPEPIGHALFAATVKVLDMACAPPSAARVEVSAASGTRRVEVHVAVVGKSLTSEELVDAEDRVGALGGRLVRVHTGGATKVTLELPCEW